MDQVKEFLRQCIRYRFWISITVASLLAIIAYVVGSGPVQAKAKTETDAIEAANKDVKQYASPGIPNGQYKPLVDEKTQVLTRDVNKAWKELYSRQAPLLTWPKQVESRFQGWGRKWPENVAESAVELAKVDYVMAYPDYVDAVYKSFRPFNYETGDGVVSAPAKESLLRPVAFDVNKLPDLGKIWSAQERLWIQRTALDVVAQVNKDAKDWDSAIIKQINLLEVGNNTAQDQRSIAKGDSLEEAEAITAPGEEAAADSAAADTSNPMGGMAAMMRGMMGGKEGGMMSGGMAGGAPESVFYVKKDQFKIMPILMSVLVDQDRVQDFLVALENSPMSIQVMDIELQKPSARVTKPEKGAMQDFSSYGDMMMGGMMRGMMGGKEGGMGGMMGYGGMASGYAGMMGRMMGGMGGRGGMEGMMGGYGMMGGMGQQSRQGTNKRDLDRSKEREKEVEAVEKSKGPSLFDPYYDIVEVKVYGQARFYNPPPADAETEPSPGEVSQDAAAQEAKTEPAKDAEAKTEPEKAAEATEPAKAEPASPEAAEAKAEPAKAAEPSAAEPAKAEPAKAEPGEPAKAEPSEPAKAEPPASEPAKPAAPGTPKA